MNAKTYLEQHPQLMDKLEAMILTKHNIKRTGAAALPEGSWWARAQRDEQREYARQAAGNSTASTDAIHAAVLPWQPSRPRLEPRVVTSQKRAET